MTSTDNASVIDLSILLGIPFHSNLVEYQKVGLVARELLIFYSCEHLHSCPLADAKALFQQHHNPPLQCHPNKHMSKTKRKNREYESFKIRATLQKGSSQVYNLEMKQHFIPSEFFDFSHHLFLHCPRSPHKTLFELIWWSSELHYSVLYYLQTFHCFSLELSLFWASF